MTPDEYTNQELRIDIGDGHKLYAQDWGNKDAETPVFFLHGGPGSQCKDKHKANFDPKTQRVIFHDQRGCGQSTPYGSLEHNTTQNLVEDIEKIAGKLGIEKFIISGGSWGSCLALAYALKYPNRVKAMVLNGIFTGSAQEIDYLDGGGFRTHFPDAWQTFLDTVPKTHRDNPGKYHARRILGDDEAAAKESAYAYGNLEAAVMSLDDRFTPGDFEEFDPSGMRIEVAYMQHGCFMPDRYILDNAHKLTMPVWLVQGRYDFVCPPRTAYELNQKLPNSRLVWTIGGHGNEHETASVQKSILLSLTS